MMRILLATIIFLFCALPAGAQTLDPWQLVGHTTTTHTGDEGVRTFTLACQADFGAAARMCTSEEVLNTIVWPTLSADSLIRPTPILTSDANSVVDASGVVGNPWG